MKRLTLILPILSFVVGCGTNPEQARQDYERNVRFGEQALEKRLTEIADDKALSDADAIRKYLDADPDMFKNLPAEVAPGWAANQKNGEWQIILHAPLQSQAADTSTDQRMESERAFVRTRMNECKRILSHLKGRKVGSVTLQIYTKITGDDKHTELFRAVMTPADLPKVEQVSELSDPVMRSVASTAAVGAVYDPRGPKIGECWKVELNRYPDLEYKKK